ncbi:MAG: MBOAT family protein [Clostridia bacterium]|nr:MBOAT family protein [Clostridia bacterium]
MVFSSIPFLYYFLPIVLCIYFIVPSKLKNIVLLLSSLFFYYWGEKVYTIVMIAMALSGYVHGLFIDKYRGTKKSKIALISSIIIGLSGLLVFKYADFAITNVNSLFGANIGLLNLVLPIGISFYTFQILSYTIDLYNGKAELQKNPINFMTYVVLFPQLIAGPIVRYVDVQRELNSRKHSLEMISYGIWRFVIGLSKKVLIADRMSEFCNVFRNQSQAVAFNSSIEVSVLFVWLYAIAYGLFIFFDFSGYSDMAIGLGKIFGFNFLENFNYPYISKSITEFWRRWHISLGSWFRDYIYIPLGGNRVAKWKWFRNIFVVWALTGFWHGAKWAFIAWGLMFGIILMIEKLFLGKWLEKLPSIFSRIYVIFFILISWIIFDAGMGAGITGNLAIAFERIKMMLGFGNIPLVTADTLYYLRSYLVIFIIAIIASTPLAKILINKIKEKNIGRKIINVLTPITCGVLLIVVTAFLVDGSFSPFIYFSF